MINAWFVMVTAVSATLMAAQRQPPADLVAWLEKARVEGTLVDWCQGQFETGRRGAYAAAVTTPRSGGRYLVIDSAATVVELARFKDAPDLACYAPADARKLNETIRSSETIRGRITPLFPTTVVCAFVENTEAVCWQYAPKSRAFVKVGEWQT